MREKLGKYIKEYSVRNKANEDIPVYSVTNTQGFCQDYFGKEVASKDKSTYKIVPRGCFAYNPSRINVGSIDWQRNEDRVIVSPLYNVFSTSELLDQQYLYYFLKSDIALQMIRSAATGSVRDNLKFSMLCEFSTNIPALEMQKGIVRILDKVKTLIDFRQQELQKLDDLVKARFVEMFGDPEHNNKHWREKSLFKLCKVGSSKRIYQNELCEQGVPFLKISDLVCKMDKGSCKYAFFIPEEKYDELVEQGLVPSPGDILVTARGTLGRCYIIAAEDRFYFQDGMITWLSDFDESICSQYIAHLFSMKGVKKQIEGLQAGSTVVYLSIAMTKNLKIMVPPIDLQKDFIAFVQQVDKSKFVVQQALDKAQLLFDSLMQQYFG